MANEMTYKKEKSLAGKSTSAVTARWKKVLVFVAIALSVIFAAAAVVVPVYVAILATTAKTTTSTTTASPTLPNQCSNYTLDTDATRLATYSVSNTGGCDVTLYATPIWVRFGGTATRMASSPPTIYRCATSATGWYTGCLPSTVGTTSTGVVCFNWQTTICDFHSTVSVTNCNGFYVYLMVSPSQCALRYCTE